jgi:hypothetical protein
LNSFSIIKLTIKPIEDQVSDIFTNRNKIFYYRLNFFPLKIHQFIGKEDDIIHYPEKVFQLLSRFHLLDKYLSPKNHGQVSFLKLVQSLLNYYFLSYNILFLFKPKFIPIFNYLLETSQIYAILKSLWKLNYEGI